MSAAPMAGNTAAPVDSMKSTSLRKSTIGQIIGSEEYGRTSSKTSAAKLSNCILSDFPLFRLIRDALRSEPASTSGSSDISPSSGLSKPQPRDNTRVDTVLKPFDCPPKPESDIFSLFGAEPYWPYTSSSDIVS